MHIKIALYSDFIINYRINSAFLILEGELWYLKYNVSYEFHSPEDEDSKTVYRIRHEPANAICIKKKYRYK